MVGADRAEKKSARSLIARSGGGLVGADDGSVDERPVGEHEGGLARLQPCTYVVGERRWCAGGKLVGGVDDGDLARMDDCAPDEPERPPGERGALESVVVVQVREHTLHRRRQLGRVRDEDEPRAGVVEEPFVVRAEVGDQIGLAEAERVDRRRGGGDLARPLDPARRFQHALQPQGTIRGGRRESW